MSDKRSDPPPLAVWFLEHTCPGNTEALTGDLIERFREGQTGGWFWKQVLIAFATGVRCELRRHWPEFCYAAAGTALHTVLWFRAPSFLWNTATMAPAVLHWKALPWPWSQVAFEVSPGLLLASAALPVLATALAMSRTFRWASLLRTGTISLALVTLHHYALDYLRAWLSRPVPGDPYYRVLMIPPELQVLFVFAAFFAAAWLGVDHVNRPANRTHKRNPETSWGRIR
jgi:hypothetical protein